MPANNLSVLFVCMGNICRSPTAEGVFYDLVVKQGYINRVQIDSAGTHAYHSGESPDRRAQEAARNRGVSIGHLRARPLTRDDFESFDYILVMDEQNYASALKRCPEHQQHKLRFFLEFAPDLKEQNVPDPYYGGKFGFERVLDMVEEASVGLLEEVKMVLGENSGR